MCRGSIGAVRAEADHGIPRAHSVGVGDLTNETELPPTYYVIVRRRPVLSNIVPCSVGSPSCVTKPKHGPYLGRPGGQLYPFHQVTAPGPLLSRRNRQQRFISCLGLPTPSTRGRLNSGTCRCPFSSRAWRHRLTAPLVPDTQVVGMHVGRDSISAWPPL